MTQCGDSDGITVVVVYIDAQCGDSGLINLDNTI